MDPVQTQLLACLSAYAKEEAQARLIPNCSWQALYDLSQGHKLAPVVFETLWKHEAFCREDKALLTRWKMDTLVQSTAQAQKSQTIVNLSQALDEAGLSHAVVKGIVCRELYQRPDLRPSGDEDLLIRDIDQPACETVLQARGFQRLPRKGDAVSHWQEPISGLHLELHTGLLSREQPQGRKLNDVLMDALSRAVLLPVTGGKIRTLPPTEHAVFLVCHALQHFIAGGVGIRTLCDVVQFVKTYEAQLDWNRFRQLLEPVRGLRFLDQIFALGTQYWGYTPTDWTPQQKPDPQPLLLDCLEAGIYGQSTETRQHSAALVADAAGNTAAKASLGRVLFPSKKTMTHRYPVLEHHPALLPACWLHRLGRYGVRVLSRSGRSNSPTQSLALGRKRMELMVQYGIFPEAAQKR